ncbi:MAG: rod shape-determining protein RodA [Bacteroidota bacterium]
MRKQEGIFKNLDWTLVGLYLLLIFMGWLSVYASVYNEEHKDITDFSQKYGKQLVWILSSLFIALLILVVEGNFFAAFSYPIYIISMVMLVLVLFIGKEVSGSKSWIGVGEFGIQPAEFAKFATLMALAKFLGNINIKMDDVKTKVICAAIIVLPMILIFFEHETGVALVYSCFILVMYREGLSGNILLLGVTMGFLFLLALLINVFVLIGVLCFLCFLLFMVIRKTIQNAIVVVVIFILSSVSVYSVQFAFEKLEPHQKKRINVFLGKESDKKKAGYNVNQSLIAIGSGGVIGKGYLQGTQTKYDFVPEQSTDFIFCTVGEEFGFVGSAVVVSLFLFLLIRIVQVAERQRSPFSRIYGYGVASVIFFHFLVNIGMTIGLVPVIGIPLPFFSYGGSSLWAFTILLFILIKLDSYRLEILR